MPNMYGSSQATHSLKLIGRNSVNWETLQDYSNWPVSEFQIRNGKHMDNWPRCLTIYGSMWPFILLYGLVYKMLIKLSEKGLNTFRSVWK